MLERAYPDTVIYLIGYGESAPVPASGRRSNSFRSTVEAAVNNALVGSSLDDSQPTGIVFVTETGERWPEVWSELKAGGKSVTPTQFPGIVHNAAAGQVAIRYSFTGPHLALVDGDALSLAAIQIRVGRATRMIVCGLEDDYNAISLVIQSQREEGQHYSLLGHPRHYASSTLRGFQRFAGQFRALADQFERFR